MDEQDHNMDAQDHKNNQSYDEIINIDCLKKNEYKYDQEKQYEYIDAYYLNKDLKQQLLLLLEEANNMPKNFLNFVYTFYIDNLDQVYREDDSINSSILSDYDNKKFGLYIKIDKTENSDQQLIFFCPKDQKIVEQFFLIKTLNESQYFPENIEISLEKSSSVISDINSSSNIKDDNDKIKNDKSDKISFTSQENIKNNKDNIFSKFINGNMFENEAINYLRSKLMNNCEISSVFYTNIKLKNQSISIFYHEFEGIFIINDKIQFDKNIIRINCKYENNTFINCKKEGKDILEINGKNLLFIEAKKNANFGGTTFEKLVDKVYKFRNFIDNLYGTKDYGVVILYLYNNEFIYNLKDFEKFINFSN